MKNCFYEKLSGMSLAIADLVAYREGMLITRINVPKNFRGSKIGSKLLREITQAADSEGVTLYLEIQPSDGLNRKQLKDWYQRYGFKQQPGIFVRLPQKA